MRSPADGPAFPTTSQLYDWELEHVHRRHDQDLAFYAELAARTGGPVLELGCGTGRLTAPLDAVGLDLDPAMLAGARAAGCAASCRRTCAASPSPPASAWW
ncbi:MAG: class I SAM-dependent methyltransferase [Actinomycetota bacterium]|nr:class I SAM-dependent methyltransferase [Actinomycetota bacterium]